VRGGTPGANVSSSEWPEALIYFGIMLAITGFFFWNNRRRRK
jgi:hypothetical protein